jgi:hypothetical protein
LKKTREKILQEKTKKRKRKETFSGIKKIETN